jgi:general secretion pathway protein A
MYEEFYGFRDNPFRLTPDPDYLFLSANHQEALGHLLFGIHEGSGVVIITGEIGAGKTTLLRTLVRNLDDTTIVAYIFNPALSAVELLQTINADLGLPASSTSKKELIDDLNRFLLTQQAAKRRVVVIIDEAQDLEPSVLEQLRLLSNLETEREKLLQIVLVGQPELRDTLARPELAQLDQRVTLRWHLGPLEDEETAAYVHHRIRVAAEGREPVQFTAGALSTIYRISKGIPRVINVLCHRALLIAYTREERRIDRVTILQAAREIGHEDTPTNRKFSRVASSPLLAGLLVFLGTGMLVFASTHGWLPTHMTSPQGNSRPASSRPPEALSAHVVSLPAAASSIPAEETTPAKEIQPEGEQAALASAPKQLSTVQVAAISQGTEHSAPTEQATQTNQELLQSLQQLSLLDSAVQAANGLLRAWGVDLLREEEWQSGTIDLGAIAHSRRLEYLPLEGSFNLLSLLDLPAILELRTPGQHEIRFVLLMGLHGDFCRVLVGREQEIPSRILSEQWFGRAYLFWKDFERVTAPLTVGSVGQQVRRLYMLLSQAPGINTRLSANARLDTFSQQTQEVIARFQKSKRLAPDGIVGPQTMIALYNSVPGYLRPSLSGANPFSKGGYTSDSQEPTQTSRDSQEDRRRKTYEHDS